MIILMFFTVIQANASDGDFGRVGTIGNNGLRGDIVFASGCEQFIKRSVSNLSKFSAENWSSDLEGMCSVEELNRLETDFIADQIILVENKVQNLSGFLSKTYQEIEDIGLAGLKSAISTYYNLLVEVDMNREVNFGCVTATDSSHDYEICVAGRVRRVLRTGIVIFDADFEIKYAGDSYNYLSFDISFDKPFERCDNGLPLISINETRTSRGEEFQYLFNQNCEYLEIDDREQFKFNFK